MKAEIDWDALPLGKARDNKIAKKAGCTIVMVRRQRARRGIPAFVDKGFCLDCGKEIRTLNSLKKRCKACGIAKRREATKKYFSENPGRQKISNEKWRIKNVLLACQKLTITEREDFLAVVYKMDGHSLNRVKESIFQSLKKTASASR